MFILEGIFTEFSVLRIVWLWWLSVGGFENRPPKGFFFVSECTLVRFFIDYSLSLNIIGGTYQLRTKKVTVWNIISSLCLFENGRLLIILLRRAPLNSHRKFPKATATSWRIWRCQSADLLPWCLINFHNLPLHVNLILRSETVNWLQRLILPRYLRSLSPCQ